jgi:TonB family protein
MEILTLEDEQALAEARVLSATERTVSVAAPSPVEGEWIILAVTPMDPAAAEEHAGKGGPIEMIGRDVTAPELIEKVDPRYPRQARNDRREGRIVLQAIIDVYGRVRALSVLRVTEGGEDLAAAAADAVAQWRYRPALREGVPVPVYFTIVVGFELR